MPRISLSSARRACLAVALLLLAFGPAQAQSNAAPAFRLLAFGDSLIHGYGLASGQTLPERLEAALSPVTPEGFLELDEGALKAIGLSRPKMRYCRALAEDILAGRIDLGGLAGLDDRAAIEHLMRAKGIGVWSAEIYLLFALRRPDVWPADDLAVQVAVQRVKGLDARPGRAAMVEIAEPWRD